MRNVQQSALRGGEFGLTFISFNPPAASRNWANRYAREERKGKRVHHSTYLQAPAAWLGPKFLAQAEYIKETQPTKYRHEYLGEVVAAVRRYLKICGLSLSRKRLSETSIPLKTVLTGAGIPTRGRSTAATMMRHTKTLYIFDELTRLRTSNEETAKLVQQRIESWESVTARFRRDEILRRLPRAGLPCRAAQKGPGSVRESMKWLQGLAAIIIDPVRCPATAAEFSEYEYERDPRTGEVLPGYPDVNNHHIDAVRYAVEGVWRRRGS
mgnify:CR=1 FL=1